jgi:hypothetical protein
MGRQLAHEAVESCSAVKILPDEAIERILRDAFAPHRCDVKFQIDAFAQSKKVALIIYASRIGARPFVVEGVIVDLLRRRDALVTYIHDVRKQLQRHNIAFAPAALLTLSMR